jgi:hypothetical protein
MVRVTEVRLEGIHTESHPTVTGTDMATTVRGAMEPTTQQVTARKAELTGRRTTEIVSSACTPSRLRSSLLRRRMAHSFGPGERPKDLESDPRQLVVMA